MTLADFPLAEIWINANQKVVLLATDAAHSVLCVQKSDSNEHYMYSVYGHEFIPLPSLTALRYKGEYIDRFSLFYPLGNGYRMYHSQLMRLGSPDSLSPFDQGGINCYSYCAGDPVNKSDRSGHAPTPHLGLGNITLALANKKISSNIGRFLPVKQQATFNKLAKQAQTIVTRRANEIANKTLTLENLLEYDISQAPDILKEALKTRKNDLLLSTINETVTIQQNFYGNSPSLENGRRGAMIYRPNRGSDSSSSNRAIRDDQHDS